jgi:hypothetical protein
MFYIYDGKPYYCDGKTIFNVEIRGSELVITNTPTSDVIQKNRTASLNDVLKMFELTSVTSSEVKETKRRSKKVDLSEVV